MYRRFFTALILLSLCAVPPVFAFGEPAVMSYSPDATGLTLEDFSSGALGAQWWRFGALQERFLVPDAPEVGPKVLLLDGQATDWYVGGRGMYVGKDASAYQGIAFWVLGSGADSGIVKVQLFEDDNGNAQVEQDHQYRPTKDDLLEYELKVDWTGWKHVTVPFSDFKDVNPGVGNDVWDPFLLKGSIGLVQVQFIYIAASPKGTVHAGLGTIRLVRSVN